MLTSTVRPQVPAGNPLPYAAIPHALIADRRLIPTDLLVVGILLGFAKGKATCWPSVATIAAAAGRCERTVQYSLKRLREAGWIGTRPDPNPTGRVLVLNWRSGCNDRREGGCRPYSPGLPPARPRPAAPEGIPEKDKGAPPRGEGIPGGRRPLGADELAGHYAGWLAFPPGHHLRELALRRIGMGGR